MPEPSSIVSALAAKVRTGHFPILRQTVSRLVALLSEPETSSRSIADAISADQAMSARILKVANSSYYRWITERVSTIHTAVVRIGYVPLRDIIITADLAEFVQTRMPEGVELPRVLAKAVVAAHMASAFGHSLRMPEQESLYASALLESLGELALAAFLPEVARRVSEGINQDGKSYHDAYLHATGVEPHVLTLCVAKAYALPENLVLPVPSWENSRDWSVPELRQALVHLANAFAANLFAPGSQQTESEFSALLRLCRDTIRLSDHTVVAIVRDAYAKAYRLGRNLELDDDPFILQASSTEGWRSDCIRQASELVRVEHST
jgi:HD-like signal output (HDOD) protein